MPDAARFVIGGVVLTRVSYFDVELPSEAVALSVADVARVPWATPVWAATESTVRVGQVFWVIESSGQTIVVDPCGASDAFLRSGPEALTHQDAAFGAFRGAGFDPDTVDTVIMSHLDGIGMNALVDATGAWSPAFSHAPILISEPEWDRVQSSDDVSGAEALQSLEAAGHVRTVALPYAVTPEVTMVIAGGHTAGMAIVVVASGRERALFLGHLALNPVHAAVDSEVPLHDDPALAATALQAWLTDAETDGALLIGPLWPAPGAARVASIDPVVLEPVSAG